jgi:hypothetical protein
VKNAAFTFITTRNQLKNINKNNNEFFRDLADSTPMAVRVHQGVTGWPGILSNRCFMQQFPGAQCVFLVQLRLGCFRHDLIPVLALRLAMVDHVNEVDAARCKVILYAPLRDDL